MTGTILAEPGSKTASSNPSVVWLVPAGVTANLPPLQPMHAVLAQKNKAFEPHMLVVTRGSAVDFPNQDPWFHNVF